MGLIFCSVAFFAAVLFTLRSKVGGLVVVLTTGYLFGIVRANYLDTYSHFLFDAAVTGFFVAYFSRWGSKKVLSPEQEALKKWVYLLLGWVVVMFLIPMQHPLIQLVGLRGNAFLVPFLLIGNWLDREECSRLAVWLSVLNHLAFAFALGEYFLGVTRFFPENAVTEIIYKSNDIARGAYRIPACFSNAHSYGGTMAMTLPVMLGAWVQPGLTGGRRVVLGVGMALAMLGIFLCGARSPILLLAVLILATTFSGKIQGTLWLGWGILLLGIAYIISNEERMQRFMSLQDTEYVMTRLEVSVNMTLLELMLTYPLGNGMGGGGTSIPYFLQHLLQDPVGVENEYGRILLEQGIVGLVLWLSFLGWYIGKRSRDRRDPWSLGKQLVWIFCLSSFVLALTGTGLMTAIPQSMLFFLSIGFSVATRQRKMPAIKKSQPPRAPTRLGPHLKLTKKSPLPQVSG